MKVLTWFGIEWVLVLLVLGLITFSANAQELSRDELDVQSIELFKAGNYPKAADGFEKLINIYPKETSYNYYLGRCYLSLNSDLDKSIKLLRFAASKNYSPDVHYYLARAYYNNYQFDEAEVALLNFKNLASNKVQQQLSEEILAASILRAREEIYLVRDVKVKTSEALKTSELEGVYALHVNGEFVRMPDEFMSIADKDKTYQGVMYFPPELSNGYGYYISSYGKKGKTKTDIYKLSQITAINFSMPEYLAEINSVYNEEYPYFDSKSQTLYFSSDRIGGLGGYDIYYSTYNKETNTFSVPKRFEFPINSAFDDFLFVPDTNKSAAIFLSNRLAYGENLTAFKIELSDMPKFVSPKSLVEVKQLAKLEVEVEKHIPLVIENLSPALKPKNYSEYDLVLSNALESQLVCDSMQAELLSNKNLLRVAKNIDERQILIASITATETNIGHEQAKADALFIKAQNISGNINVVEVEKVNENIEFKKEVNGLKVYTYLPSEQYAEINEIDITKEKIIDIKKEPRSFTTNFKILANSPYNENSPIPEDEEVPDGLIYRIQLGAFGNKLPMNTFVGLSPVSAEIIEERNLTKYYVGYFGSSKEAHDALTDVKTYGFGDAFIVPYYKKEKISINAARELEFGQKLNVD